MISEQETCHEDGGSMECSWYENDLQLAAELGKTLLERNMELEEELRNTHQAQSDQALEIDLLQRQLEVLRNVNTSRMRMYEDVDHNSHELEKLNERLMKERKADKECIQSLTETVKTLEERCDELQELQELATKEERERSRMREKRIRSVPSLLKMDNNEHNFQNGYDYLGFPSLFGSSMPKSVFMRDPVSSEVQSLRESVKRLEVQLSIEQNKRKVTETEMLGVLEENHALEERIKNLAESKKVAIANKVVKTVQTENRSASREAEGVCTECGTARKQTADKSELIEHDLDEIPRGQLVRLKNGGSAYGSRESLHMIGLETDDTTPSLEVCSAILASDMTERIFQEQEHEQSVKPSFSLLGELEEQYRKLVIRYEALIESKNQRSPMKLDMATQDNLDGSGSTQARSSDGVIRRPKDLTTIPDSLCRRSLDLSSPMNPIEGHFENGPPEYKRLFKEIFETLRRSVVYEDEHGTQRLASDNQQV